MTDEIGLPPKPTVFLPSVNEKKPHEIGIYICLLENFFPDVIKVDWKEKNGKKILQSLETRPIKTDDNKYMKLSWLEVTETSMDKEHVCVVKHEFNDENHDQEIVFPSINEGLLQIQLNYITAYYTYVLLLLKSMVYFAIIAFIGVGQLKLEQPKMSISKTRDKTAHIPCIVTSKNFNSDYIHWYRQKTDQNIEHLLHVISTTQSVSKNIGGKTKLEANKDPTTSRSTLKVNFVQKEDEAVYYCAVWDHSLRITKITYTKTNFRSRPHPSSISFLFLGFYYTDGNNLLSQIKISITKRKGSTAFLECPINTKAFKKNVYVHWYRQKPEQPLQRILYISSNENVVHEQGISEERYEAKKRHDDLPASLRIHRVNESDAGLYYCACWDTQHERAPGALNKNPPVLRHLITGGHQITHTAGVLKLGGRKSPGLEAARRGKSSHKHSHGRMYSCHLHCHDCMKAGNGHGGSRLGEAVTSDFCRSCNQCASSGWIKVFGEGTKLIVIPSDPHSDTTKFSLEDSNGTMQLQFIHTSAYYTYLFLFVKSMIYSAIITVSVFRRTGVCGNGNCF
ncbi:PREDICTED: uncharacterized protein LOC101635365 [Condylura cristata]|uniref:uncharacterized protein LOC101635365 n=1 Tax=Condylura cristata TaxID=143302 RepID=UPI000643BA57|nr:PREDICTED: uncharacterized protein LOC101635365 [Condylura cristata]